MTKTQFQTLLDGLAQVNLRIDESLAQVELRLDKVDQRLDKVDQRLDKVDQRLDNVDQRLDHVDQRLDKIDLRLNTVDETIRGSQAEMRRHFDIVVEHMDHKIGLVAEGLASLEQRFEAGQRQTGAEFSQLRVELRTEIRLAYTTLDGRISALEKTARA